MPENPAVSTALPATAESAELGPVEDLATRAEDGIQDGSSRRGIETMLDRHAGDLGIAEVLGHDECSDRGAGDDIRTQERAVV